MTQFDQASGLLAAATTSPTSPPADSATSHGPGVGEALSSGGHLLWQISGAMPGGHLAAGGLLAALAGAGYLKVKFDGGVGAKGGFGKQKDGWATRRDIRENVSAEAMLENATVYRPSLAGVPKRELSPLDVAWLVGRDHLYNQPVYSSIEDMTLVFSPPRSGKTAHLAGQVIDAPGACVATSTRGDLYTQTQGLRSRRGPVHVFNPDFSGIPNTLSWNPVKGCREPGIAFRRAGYLLAAAETGGVQDKSFWNEQSYRVLRTLLMAADYGDRTLLDVRRWITQVGDQEPLEILDSVPGIPEGWVSDLRFVLNSPDKTRDSILLTLIQCLECLALPQVAQIVTPQAGVPNFDPAMFLRAKGTLYMLGRDRSNGSVAPLFSLLAGEIYEVAHELARTSVGGRLDPPLAFTLDEAAIICPLPIQSWGADAGGSGITLTVSVQSPSQLYDRWGLQGGKTIWSLSNKLALPGLSLPEDVEALSMLVGERDQEMTSISKNAQGEQSRSVSVQRVRVLPASEVRRLKKFTGLYLARSHAPMIVKYTPVWKRDDVKAYKKEIKAQERLQAKLEKQGVVLEKATMPPMPAYQPVVPPQTTPDQNPWITQNPNRKAV
jgi:type IV secretory pathway TraG/TraD family ATPase VirD4